MTLREAQLTLQENFATLSSEHPRIIDALKVAMECLDREIELDFETRNVNVAAKRYAKEHMILPVDSYNDGEIPHYEYATMEVFKDGVIWMAKEHAGQVADAVEKGFNEGIKYAQEQGETQEHFVIGQTEASKGHPIIVCYPSESFKIGDEVIVQIRKK